MIKDIQEINFPSYATLSTATATLVDMGDRTITAQVKIDGAIVPDFSYDWEVVFQGERYIHPLREPQASKGNESISSLIDLTFYHKGIYDLKRYFFVDLATTESGTAMVDKYIVPMSLNIEEFVTALNNVLAYYYGNTYKVYLNPDFEFDATYKKLVDINYTHIWDVLTQTYELFGARWTWQSHDESDEVQYHTIKIGYPSQEVSHIFKYGFDGGLLKFERQVQSAEIRNQMFGRGGSQNLPYRYFKKQDPNNTSWKADPDWIPELELISFSELRGKSFRDYVRGWKAQRYGGTPVIGALQTDAYKRGYADSEKSTDEHSYFNPIEYVEDKVSIAKYGLIQGGLDNNEEIYPTIQKRTIDGLGRADEVVAVEEILVDEPTSNTESESEVMPISEDIVVWYDSPIQGSLNMTVASATIPISSIKEAHILKDIDISIVQHIRCKEVFEQYDAVNNRWYTLSTKTIQKVNPLAINSLDVAVINENTNTKIEDLAHIPNDANLYFVVTANVSGFVKKQTNIPHPNPNFSAYTGTLTPDDTFKIVTSINTEIDYTTIHGEILGNYEDDANRISGRVTVSAQGTGRVTLQTKEFTVPEGGSTNANVPVRITPSKDTSGSYSPETHIDAINVDTKEVITPINMPEGTYYLRVVTDITNLLTSSETYKVELLPAYIYYPYDAEQWRPTFDIWIKNIWGDERKTLENDLSYAERVWTPILGDHKGNEAKVVFSSGGLSGHSDWEFPIINAAFDDTKELDGVKSHWRLTLGKSNAEVEATGKWIPSIQTQAHAGDHFYFIGIDMPHQYVLWAEEELDKWKRDNMTSQVKPTFVVQTDKVRLNQLQEGETQPLLNSLRVGRNIRTADFRFIESEYEVLHLQSITYTWDASTIMLPNVEVVLSENVVSGKDKLSKFQVALKKTEIQLSAKVEKHDSALNRLQITARDASNLASKNEQSNAILSARDNELWKQEQSAITSERAAIEEDYAQFLRVYSILRDANGDELLDANGDILCAREYNSAWDKFDVAYTKYSKELSAVINSKGATLIAPQYASAKAEYYDARAKLSRAITVQTKQDIEETSQAVKDLDYLKEAFGAENILDSNGVVLSRLVAVKDSTTEDANVVAGIYGGGVDTLDVAGYKDAFHGTLMMFAGATSAQVVANSKYRVYEDGTLIAEEGVFGGLIRRGAKTITPENIDDYSVEASITICGATKTMTRVVDVVSAGSYLVFDGGSDDYAWSNVLDSIEFDIYDPNHPSNVSLPSGKRSLKAMLPLVGTQVMIYFMRGNFEGITLEDKMLVGGTIMGISCWKPTAGNVLIATCKMQANGGKKAIVWEYEMY